ncbi:ABC transporter ATP-binding protein [Vagococcus acidifermentans]|uniref:Peptide ABC transporter ATP-binding protein n=1 Tax=Vagococcus acidifermentans TaxID=564710 RepID=A0A430AYX3_9ENTE|nr:ABC transporter ATP-binding protein [Vagococcus acidifermentans]RSU13261.1 peptide ABC transporter ATP-binding protein [Vagococcus acidifermentans]
MTDKILEVKELKTYFSLEGGVAKSVDGVSFSVEKSKTLGIVGESGCGKSVTSLSIMRLVESPPGKIEGGSILFKGEELLAKSEKEMRHIRGNQIAMIFQEPMTSLNPLYTIGNQLVEAIRLHEPLSKKEAVDKAVSLLKMVNIPLPEKRIHEYPHQLSGGMRQRVMIAMALSCQPDLLICDEPTTALDVTIQAQILTLIQTIQKETGTSVMMITHDLGVIAEMADDVMVMYAGKVVEQTDADSLFDAPLHPYTQGLLSCIPKVDSSQDNLNTIPGMVPGYNDMPEGCSFYPRCPFAKEICQLKQPHLIDIEGHLVRCHKYTAAYGEVEMNG